MTETEGHRALTIAARLLEENGVCLAESNNWPCLRSFPTDEDCRNCIKIWLTWQARRELEREQSKKKK
nr:MAG TPA: hypothetical protein [Caudoviricetes sp.]